MGISDPKMEKREAENLRGVSADKDNNLSDIISIRLIFIHSDYKMASFEKQVK